MKRARQLRLALTKYFQQSNETETANLTNVEWKHIDYLIEILNPFEYYTKCIAKSQGVTIQLVFEIYNQLIEHMETHIEKLQLKRVPWKVKMRDALRKGKDKLSHYYGQTYDELGRIYSTAAILCPSMKFDYFKTDVWSDDFCPETGESWVGDTPYNSPYNLLTSIVARFLLL